MHRPKEAQDSATPAAQSIAVPVPLRLYPFTGDEAFRRAAAPVLQAAQPPMYVVHFVAPVLGGLQVSFWGVLLAAAHSGRRAAHRTAVTGWLMWYAGVQGLATLSAALAGVLGLLSPVLSLGALVCLAGALWAAAQRPAASRRGP